MSRVSARGSFYLHYIIGLETLNQQTKTRIIIKFIEQMYQHHLKKKQLRELTTLTPASDEHTIKRVAVPFHPQITDKLQAVFKKHQIKIVHSTRSKLANFL
jgi:hypothetical protein